MRRFPTAAVLLLALALPVGAAEKPGLRDLERGMDALLGATADARAEGRMGPEANRAREYLAELVVRDPALAQCLPKAGTLEIASLLTLGRPAAPLSRYGGDPDAMVRDAVFSPDGRCRVTESNFLQAMLRASSAAGPSYRATIREAITAYVHSEAARDPANAECLAKPGAKPNLYLALAGYFATLDEGADPSAATARAAAKGAVARLCAEEVPVAEFLRDPSQPRPPPAVPGCKRDRYNLIAKKAPAFPRSAIQADIEQATVLMHVRVAADGIPHSIRVVRTSPPVLHGVFDAATRALLEWKFAPGECPFIAEIPLDFKLRD